jgi:hypothetical protein
MADPEIALSSILRWRTTAPTGPLCSVGSFSPLGKPYDLAPLSATARDECRFEERK